MTKSRGTNYSAYGSYKLNFSLNYRPILLFSEPYVIILVIEFFFFEKVVIIGDNVSLKSKKRPEIG